MPVYLTTYVYINVDSMSQKQLDFLLKTNSQIRYFNIFTFITVFYVKDHANMSCWECIFTINYNKQ